jgi:tripartite-type tricarboxylate transporter receptor subunit TctC
MSVLCITKVSLKSLLIACTVCVSAASAWAADPTWPSRSVRIIVPFSAGGIADVLARTVGQRLGEKWSQQVIIENVTGAGGNIGMAEAIKGNPDGYTVVLAPGGNLTINPHYYKKLPFDVDKDFIPVTILADAPNVLVVSQKLGVATFKDLVELGRKRAQGLTYASPGEGSTQHLAGAMLGLKTNVKTLHVPYRGLTPGLNDVVSGEVDMMFLAVSTAAPFIESGKLVPLAIAGPQRVALLPNVPSMPEVGQPDFKANSWYAFVVRTGTPDAIVQKLNKDINEVLKQDHDHIVALGVVPSGKGLGDFAVAMREESLRWKNVISSAGISQQ